MRGMAVEYQKMYEAIRHWNETSFNENPNEHYLYEMEWTLDEMGNHGWTGEAAENEWYHYKEVKNAHKALKVALQNALGIEQVKKEC